MTTALKRTGAALLTLLMFCMLTLGASAAANTPVGVKFWKENSDKESMANSGIDSDREATLARQSNGTYTLTLPLKQVSKMGVTGSLSGLTIGGKALFKKVAINECTAVVYRVARIMHALHLYR